MEKQIKRTASSVKNVYGLFWAFPLLGVLLGESGAGCVGIYASDVRLVYFAETAVILLTAIFVPLSLKLFARILSDKMSHVTLPAALKMYVKWYALRLAMLALPVWTGLLAYYILLSSTGVLCALIALTASLFCLPGEDRLRRELQIDKEQN